MLSPEVYISLKASVQYISTLFAVTFNLFLIYLVQTKSPKKMGTYKYLMIYFSIFAILFTCLETVAEPVRTIGSSLNNRVFQYGHNYGCTFLVIIKTETSLIGPGLASILICFLIGCFGFTISMIAVHFIFRFFALERQGKLRYFDVKYLPIWFAIPILAGVNLTLLCYFVFKPTKELSDYVRLEKRVLTRPKQAHFPEKASSKHTTSQSTNRPTPAASSSHQTPQERRHSTGVLAAVSSISLF